jgi:hypothetical protein
LLELIILHQLSKVKQLLNGSRAHANTVLQLLSIVIGVLGLTIDHIIKVVTDVVELGAEDFEVGEERVVHFVGFQ